MVLSSELLVICPKQIVLPIDQGTSYETQQYYHLVHSEGGWAGRF